MTVLIVFSIFAAAFWFLCLGISIWHSNDPIQPKAIHRKFTIICTHSTITCTGYNPHFEGDQFVIANEHDEIVVSVPTNSLVRIRTEIPLEAS